MKMHNIASLSRLGAFCALSAFVSAPALAAPINYGDFDDYANGGVVGYQNVTESTATDEVPLFGPPEATENILDFDPEGFGASASNGDIDITDGQLNFEFSTLPGTGLTSLEIKEGGDYSFLGGTAAGTSINFGVYAEVMVTEVNGIALAPADQFNVFTNNGASFMAPGGLVQNAMWQLSTVLEFGPALSTAGFAAGSLVTGGEFVLNNTLIAQSEQGSLSFLAKKDFKILPGGSLDPDNVIPEPTAAVLVSLAVAGFVARRR